MNYSSLLLQIENQLLSLNKKGLKYINIGALPDFELKSVIDGLEEMISIENGISEGTCKTKNKPSEKSEKYPPIMFIGEGPGADEDTQGEPFVGRAGRLLTKMISAIGIERDDVYITNIVKCRPPDNRNPNPAEISCCLPIIKQQIEILNPKLIVTLGNIPTKTLIPDVPGITKARGKIKQYEKWTVLPTFHPSYLLRNRSAMPQAWEDFKKITEFTFNSIQG